jgi:hypothetical protein
MRLIQTAHGRGCERNPVRRDARQPSSSLRRLAAIIAARAASEGAVTAASVPPADHNWRASAKDCDLLLGAIANTAWG